MREEEELIDDHMGNTISILKFGYVIVGGIGIHKLDTVLWALTYLFIYETQEV